ncbi:TetR/AcrR family transcriptional regulator [Anaerosacchariphilus polymeriproducens]|uniref:TetR/AcrR family transcriptional regulator n=1 Tax=Anaerosacchariphilus polymeriproducens TaxID=1812858 RepID=A0A371AW54_9FIRM|nr:TetR/AcrR family transcriptional regulator [Anaerosacchariphilus polymeriproducens]RDU23700.1 TetR/AcrR family transcriptional regulator [Anaerosacchariphilus polymeriproducens]
MEQILSKYEIRTNQKKNAIIKSANKLFLEKGFVSTSIKEIAAVAHVSQVSIYNYFGSKDSLVIECVKSIVQETIDKAYALLDTELPYLDKLSTALSLCTSDINNLLSAYLSTSATADENFMKLISEGVQELQTDLYIQYIEAGKNAGYIDSLIPTALILKFIFAINTINISPENYKEEVNYLHQLFLHGILI